MICRITIAFTAPSGTSQRIWYARQTYTPTLPPVLDPRLGLLLPVGMEPENAGLVVDCRQCLPHWRSVHRLMGSKMGNSQPLPSMHFLSPAAAQQACRRCSRGQRSVWMVCSVRQLIVCSWWSTSPWSRTEDISPSGQMRVSSPSFERPNAVVASCLVTDHSFY